MEYVIPLILMGVVFSVSGQACLKTGMTRIGRIPALASREFATLPLRAVREPFILLGIPLYIMAALVWVMVLSRVDLSYAYPFLGLNYVFVVLVSKVALGEEVNYVRWTGVAMILLGVATIGWLG